MIKGEVTSDDAIQLLDLLERSGIDVIVDGGWAVDAVLGTQTRTHLDLDIAIPAIHLSYIPGLLAGAGFQRFPTSYESAHEFVVQDDRLRRLDVQSHLLDEHGNNIGGLAYEGQQLTGHGKFADRPVRCIAVNAPIVFHLGYRQDEEVYPDVLTLCEAFDLPIPAEFACFR